MTADTLHFLDAVGGLPEQLATAHEAAGGVHADRFPRGDEIRNIVVIGMGGSGIAGDVVAASFNDELPVPIMVLKQMRVPAFVGPETLAFAVSYSGDTEETVSMASQAIECGAQLVAVSRGGELADLADACRGVAPPVLRTDTCRVRRSARSSRRCSSRCFAWASRPARTPT